MDASDRITPAPDLTQPAYFVREGAARFRPTEHVGGAWDPDEQHVAPALGLLAHAVEADRDRRRGADLELTRFSCDILGVLPLAPVDVAVAVLRPGRTIELVEARLEHAGRAALVARAWLARRYDTAELEGTSFEPVAGPQQVPAWDGAGLWPGGFVRSLRVHREQAEPGRAVFWLRTDLPLIAGEAVSPTARALGVVDVANGLTPRAAPDRVAFPNLDLTAHLVRAPRGPWVGCDTTVTFGPRGAGLTSSVVHDEDGPFGTVAQTLTVRPR